QVDVDIVRKTCVECGETFERARCAAIAAGTDERCRLAVVRMDGNTCAFHDPQSVAEREAEYGARLLEVIRQNPGSARSALMRFARINKGLDRLVVRLLDGFADAGMVTVAEDSSDMLYGKVIRRYTMTVDLASQSPSAQSTD